MVIGDSRTSSRDSSVAPTVARQDTRGLALILTNSAIGPTSMSPTTDSLPTSLPAGSAPDQAPMGHPTGLANAPLSAHPMPAHTSIVRLAAFNPALASAAPPSADCARTPRWIGYHAPLSTAPVSANCILGPSVICDPGRTWSEPSSEIVGPPVHLQNVISPATAHHICEEQWCDVRIYTTSGTYTMEVCGQCDEDTVFKKLNLIVSSANSGAWIPATKVKILTAFGDMTKFGQEYDTLLHDAPILPGSASNLPKYVFLRSDPGLGQLSRDLLEVADELSRFHLAVLRSPGEQVSLAILPWAVLC